MLTKAHWDALLSRLTPGQRLLAFVKVATLVMTEAECARLAERLERKTPTTNLVYDAALDEMCQLTGAKLDGAGDWPESEGE